MITLSPCERSQLTSDAQDDVSKLFERFKHKVATQIASLDDEESITLQGHLEEITREECIGRIKEDDEYDPSVIGEINAAFAQFQKEAIDRIAILPEKNGWFVQRHFTKIAQDGFQKEISEQRLLVSTRRLAPDLEFDRVAMEMNTATFEMVMALYQGRTRLGRLCKRHRYFDNPLRIETYYELDKEN